MALTHETLIEALRKVQDPELHRDIVSLKMVKDVRIEGDDVHAVVQLTSAACPMKEKIEADVTTALRQAGARNVKVELTAPDRTAGKPPQKPRTDALPQVKNIVAVGAGKGGVGKSTVALNVAIALHRAGSAVGIMDGDVYGPSMPTMLGLRGAVQEVRGAKLIPFNVHGIRAMSIGLMPGVDADKPLIWRGPMAQGAFKQLLADSTEWPPLDYLIIDLPPGTGDVPLTLCQMLPLSGAVIVATPQQVALDDALRALRMFQTLEAPILGIIENMSYLITDDGQTLDLYGRGGAQKMAQRLSLPFLGELPMFRELTANSDAGTPLKNFEGNPRLRQALETIASNLTAQINARNLRSAGPEFVMS
jgi:ATP-binding protein involved in chromosome partitioning